jgi:hypothetical protein
MSFFRRAAEPLLRDRDFLPVALPTTDVQVLQVLTRQRSALRRYSDLAKVLAAADGSPAPTVTADQPAVSAEGTARRTLKAGIGLGLVSGIVRALGGNAGLDLSIATASTVEFGYEDVTTDRVDLADLDAWLGGADFRPGLRNITDLLAAEDIYVITATLKARSVSVTLNGDTSAGATVDVPAIQSVVGAKVSVSAGGQRSERLTFTGKVALTVAAKAAQLKVDGHGFWVNERPVTGGEIRGLGEVTYLREPVLRLE